MVDNRSAGFFGIGGSFNFKGGDISGTAAKSQDDKMDGNEYFAIGQEEEEQQESSRYTDRSAQLRATLNSLAMMNVANVLNTQKLEKKEKEERERKKNESEKSKKSEEKSKELDEEFLDDLDENTVSATIAEENDEDLF